jgi:CrcB protein
MLKSHPAWQLFVAVFIGGIVGSAFRMGLSFVMSDLELVPSLWIIVIVNMLGCGVLGWFLLWGDQRWRSHSHLHDVWRPLIQTGLLGGFTSTSTFAVAVPEFFQQSEFVLSLIYMAISVFGGWWLGFCFSWLQV